MARITRTLSSVSSIRTLNRAARSPAESTDAVTGNCL